MIHGEPALPDQRMLDEMYGHYDHFSCPHRRHCLIASLNCSSRFCRGPVFSLLPKTEAPKSEPKRCKHGRTEFCPECFNESLGLCEHMKLPSLCPKCNPKTCKHGETGYCQECFNEKSGLNLLRLVSPSETEEPEPELEERAPSDEINVRCPYCHNDCTTDRKQIDVTQSYEGGGVCPWCGRRFHVRANYGNLSTHGWDGKPTPRRK
jgi:hypothetical protein